MVPTGEGNGRGALKPLSPQERGWDEGTARSGSWSWVQEAAPVPHPALRAVPPSPNGRRDRPLIDRRTWSAVRTTKGSVLVTTSRSGLHRDMEVDEGPWLVRIEAAVVELKVGTIDDP